MYRLVLLVFLLLIQPVWANPDGQDGRSERQVSEPSGSSSLYSRVEPSIYQIRVLDKRTGRKRSIGSGFIVARSDILATNYHVISAYANNPDTYALDYFSTNGDTGSLKLLDVDILHDLAVLQAEEPLGEPLETALIPDKGAMLYAFGNPLDLGFSLVIGSNNGVLNDSEGKNILFSGSLNSGMSGGPTLNEEGQVVGVNVATAGNDVSFLVSVQYLNVLLERLELRDFQPVDDLLGQVLRDLRDHSLDALERLLDNQQKNNWHASQIGHFTVPMRLGRFFRCWDGSNLLDKLEGLSVLSANCSNELDIYLDDGLSVGSMQYQYYWYEASDMFPPRFYRIYEAQNSSGMEASGSEDTVTRFKCHTGFIDVSGKDFKMTFCRRDYVRYPGLSDLLATGAMVGEKNQGMLFDLYMTGTDFERASELVKRMLEAFEWTP